MKRRKYARAVFLPLLFYGISFLSLALIPFVNRIPLQGRRAAQIALALVFWGFLAGGVYFTVRMKSALAPLRRSMEAKGKKLPRTRPGLFCFSSEPKHLAVYGVAVIGLILLAADLLGAPLPDALIFPVLAVTLFCVALHGVIDGNSFRILRLYDRYLEARHEKADT